MHAGLNVLHEFFSGVLREPGNTLRFAGGELVLTGVSDCTDDVLLDRRRGVNGLDLLPDGKARPLSMQQFTLMASMESIAYRATRIIIFELDRVPETTVEFEGD